MMIHLTIFYGLLLVVGVVLTCVCCTYSVRCWINCSRVIGNKSQGVENLVN